MLTPDSPQADKLIQTIRTNLEPSVSCYAYKTFTKGPTLEPFGPYPSLATFNLAGANAATDNS